METIYLSLRAHVAVGTFFMKSPVDKNMKIVIDGYELYIGEKVLEWSDN